MGKTYKVIVLVESAYTDEWIAYERDEEIQGVLLLKTTDRQSAQALVDCIETLVYGAVSNAKRTPPASWPAVPTARGRDDGRG